MPEFGEHGSFISELGLRVTELDEGQEGTARLVPELFVPGSCVLRTSVLATWADVIAGTMAFDALAPTISVTLDLDVQLHRQVGGDGEVTGIAKVVKAGRSVVVCDVWFHDGDPGDPFAISHLTFMASPNPAHVIPEDLRRMGRRPPAGRLPVRFAERVGCEVVGPGVAEVPRSLHGVNAAGNVQGGLVALVAEEAAASAAGPAQPWVASSLAVRYLRPVSAGPARATATVTGPLAHVQVVDAGRDDRLAAVVVLRLEPVVR